MISLGQFYDNTMTIQCLTTVSWLITHLRKCLWTASEIPTCSCYLPTEYCDAVQTHLYILHTTIWMNARLIVILQKKKSIYVDRVVTILYISIHKNQTTKYKCKILWWQIFIVGFFKKQTKKNKQPKPTHFVKLLYTFVPAIVSTERHR